RYPNDIGAWGAAEVRANLPVDVGSFRTEIQGQMRVYDGLFIGTDDQFVEIKASVSAQKKSIGLSGPILREIQLDADMIPKPTWIFVGKRPSAGLIAKLEESHIPWHQLHVSHPAEEER
ncbi:MAG: hypothetical protein MN733_27975, partial [Nitrososphaera sp.]|nr:hypothetical protein [Nitrososphaera sp.]